MNIENCLDIMRSLALSDPFFAEAIKQYDEASTEEREGMNDYLLSFVQDSEESGINLETLLKISCYY